MVRNLVSVEGGESGLLMGKFAGKGEGWYLCSFREGGGRLFGEEGSSSC